MSGPVSNSLAQLEDALLEAGLEKEVLVSALVTELHSLDGADLRLNPHVPPKRQRVWDHLAALWPTWRAVTIGADHELALREERSPAARYARWMRRNPIAGVLTEIRRATALPALEFRPINFGTPQGIIDEHLDMRPVDARAGRVRIVVDEGMGHDWPAAFVTHPLPLTEEQVSVWLEPPPTNIGRVPAGLVYRPGRRKRR